MLYKWVGMCVNLTKTKLFIDQKEDSQVAVIGVVKVWQSWCVV